MLADAAVQLAVTTWQIANAQGSHEVLLAVLYYAVSV